MKVLFTRPSFTRDLPWGDLEPALPGWDIDACKPDEVPAHLAGADVICPLGTTIDRRLIQAGAFGLVQRFGVGIERAVRGQPPALGGGGGPALGGQLRCRAARPARARKPSGILDAWPTTSG